MQDVILYVAADMPLGTVQDKTGGVAVRPPVLIRGVPVKLHIRLFSSMDGAEIYPAQAFSGVDSWSFVMDADYDNRTNCKIIADNENIELNTVKDGDKNYTEVSVPIPNMNTPGLDEILENMESVCMTAELVGYDSEKFSIFALQVKHFTIRNRISVIAPDDVNPPELTLTYDNVTPNLESDTLTATTNEVATILYQSPFSASWVNYMIPITVRSNGTWRFKAIDLAGNMSTVQTVTYANISEAEQGEWGRPVDIGGNDEPPPT